MKVKDFLKKLLEFYHDGVGETNTRVIFYAEAETFSWVLHDSNRICFTLGSTITASEIYSDWLQDSKTRDQIISDIEITSKQFSERKIRSLWTPTLSTKTPKEGAVFFHSTEFDYDKKTDKNDLKFKNSFYQKEFCDEWCKNNPYMGPWIWPGKDTRIKKTIKK